MLEANWSGARQLKIRWRPGARFYSGGVVILSRVARACHVKGVRKDVR